MGILEMGPFFELLLCAPRLGSQPAFSGFLRFFTVKCLCRRVPGYCRESGDLVGVVRSDVERFGVFARDCA